MGDRQVRQDEGGPPTHPRTIRIRRSEGRRSDMNLYRTDCVSGPSPGTSRRSSPRGVLYRDNTVVLEHVDQWGSFRGKDDPSVLTDIRKVRETSVRRKGRKRHTGETNTRRGGPGSTLLGRNNGDGVYGRKDHPSLTGEVYKYRVSSRKTTSDRTTRPRSETPRRGCQGPRESQTECWSYPYYHRSPHCCSQGTLFTERVRGSRLR